MVLECSQAVGDDLLGDQRAGGVVDENAGFVWRVAGGDVGEGAADRIRPGGAALDDRAYLATDELPGFLVIVEGHDKHDVVDVGRLQRGEVFLFGAILALSGLLYLVFTVRQRLIVLEAGFAIGSYLFVYTPLKRKTTLSLRFLACR